MTLTVKTAGKAIAAIEHATRAIGADRDKSRAVPHASVARECARDWSASFAQVNIVAKEVIAAEVGVDELQLVAVDDRSNAVHWSCGFEREERSRLAVEEDPPGRVARTDARR